MGMKEGEGLNLTAPEMFQAGERLRERRSVFWPDGPESDARLQEKKSVLDLALTLREQFQANKQLRYEAIENPYSSKSGLITGSEVSSVLSEEDVVRAIVLAEPEAEYDDNFKTASRLEKQRLLYKQIEDSEKIVMHLTSNALLNRMELMDMSNKQLYSLASHEAFGTDDQAVIDENFSQKQRRGIRLAIVNFIQDLRLMQPYLVQFSDNPTQAAKKVLKVAKFSGEIDVGVTLIGIPITVPEDDYGAILKTKVFGHGVKLVNEPAPPFELEGRVVLLNRGGVKSGHEPGEFFAPEDIAGTKGHEFRHSLFEFYFKQVGFFSLDFIQKLINNSPGLQDKREHMEDSELLRKWFTQFTRDELIAYRLGSDYNFLRPNQIIGGKNMMREDVTEVRRSLLANSNLNRLYKRS